ncbi:glycosyltransferase [Mobilicoccus caccae]|uniref:Erythromycin biosynthesis protein CIII-like C-terminal domain-containing protein n=1 Tax=Mobilicoccus caccae TaxID=1859295 RepID=A0ABQ6IUZ6_9MICO|nr:nucleotide disphospho-sugar-binding domain-containing protein [Mobilicoccus caccae]GMA41113.1 hypothetical protein GCM10025883_31580 [Mobilicoccus caccae]
MGLVLLGIGSRGDLAPLLALAGECRSRGAEVTVVALRDYAGLVGAAGAVHVPVDADVAEAMWHPDSTTRRLMLAQPGLMFLGMTTRMRRAAAQVVEAVERAVRPGDTVVAGLATAGVAVALAPRHPVVLALFAPVLPSDDPAGTVMAAGLAGVRVPGRATRLTSSVGWLMSVEMSGRAGRLMRHRNGAGRGDLIAAEALGLRILLAADPALVPPSSSWPTGVRQTGFWTRSARLHVEESRGGAVPEPGTAAGQQDWSGRLEAFLAAGPAPVYVGFGTCPVADPDADLEKFVRAARLAGVRLVTQPSPGAHPASHLGDDVLVLGEAPHDLVFGEMAAVVHHGGAGTMSTAVRAGVPSAVVPHLGDQGYWGRRVAELGLGPRPVPRARLTTRRLAGLLRTLTGPEAPRMRARALATAAELRTDGVSVAADALLR